MLTDVGVCCVSRAAVSMVQLPPCPPPRSLCAAPLWTFQPPPLWGPCPLIQSPPTLYCSCVWRFVLEGLFPLFRYVGRNLSVHAQPQPHTHAHALRRHKQQNYCLRPSHVAALIFTPRTIPTPPARGRVYWPFESIVGGLRGGRAEVVARPCFMGGLHPPQEDFLARMQTFFWGEKQQCVSHRPREPRELHDRALLCV